MNAPALRQLAPDVSVAGQLEPADMAWAASAGFRSVINNRPDFEAGPEQPTSAAMQRAAEAAGLAYVFLPVQPAEQTPDEIAQFGKLIGEMPKPILAFCRSGARSGRLYHAATGA
jgi:uncharacterized protein (TIGR01244 family)